ncbi:ZPBP1 protein, partial [Pandion haliaetus]|nr:ZPBP1 protein [Pandion haliaetus]
IVVLTLLFYLLTVQPSKRVLRSAGPRHSSLKIVGSVILPVKVYVKLNHNSPRILCLTNHLRNLELIDPIFQWNGPGGGLSSENSSVQISPTGTLILRDFNLSGVYTCSIVYKLTARQPDKNLVIKYLIYGKLPIQVSSECHHVKMQRGGLQNEIFFTFSVASLDREKHNKLCQQSACDATHRLNKAKRLIERFFKQQVEVSRKRSEPLPEIYYIEGTLQMVWVDRCYPGYGMNAVVHPDCPECC